MDRNTLSKNPMISVNVALRKESVDRNSSGAKADSVSKWSLSARRAWIEMGVLCLSCVLLLVALRKESVDRNSVPFRPASHLSKVALRKESVDRNSEINTRGSEKMKSLSARRAWIEIEILQCAAMSCYVALRKESVDRNRRDLMLLQ